MKRASAKKQRGLSMYSVLVLAMIIGVLAVIATQVFPTVVEYAAVLRAVNKAKYGSTVAEVRSIFDKQASIDNIDAITGKDLDISKTDADNVVVSFAYQREIHMVGPAWLVLRYSGKSK